MSQQLFQVLTNNDVGILTLEKVTAKGSHHTVNVPISQAVVPSGRSTSSCSLLYIRLKSPLGL